MNYVEIGCGNGMRSSLGYDQRGFVQIVDHYNVPSNLDYSWRQYWRDNRDRITAFQKGLNPGANLMENGRGDRFHYDEEGQLLEGWYNAVDPANSGAGNTRYDGFAYDALGNRTQNNFVASRGATSFIRRDNGLNQYSSWTPSIIYHDDNYPGWNPPGNGVTMAEGWITASFNALNQPIAIWSPAYSGSDVAYFGYDPLGRCVKRWVSDSGDVYSNPATYFHYDGWNLLQEGNNAWGPARVYVHGNRVDEIVWSYNTFTGDQAYHHYDARGHCTLLTDNIGGILEQYEYDAFGQPYFFDSTAQPLNSSTVGNRFLFTGREWLSDLKLYDYRNRMYQPELGRFLQPDPKQFAAGDYNLYRYCHNDPVNKNDPFGLDTAVIVGLQRDDSDNVFGHVAVAMTGQGVFSYGTAKTDWAASATGFVSSQSEHRTQFVYTVATTPAQEQAIRQSLDAQNKAQLPDVKKDPVGGYKDNCATRTSEALKAGGIDIGKAHTPNQVASKMEKLVSQDKANATTVPTKANIENYPKLKELDPRR